MLETPKKLRRYLNVQERNRYYMGWVARFGPPARRQGCICCAELDCPEDCRGIDDPRVRHIDDEG